MMNDLSNSLSQLFYQWSGEQVDNIEEMSAHGSDRAYFRIFGTSGKTAIGVHNENYKENLAFLTFSKQFHECDIPVPEIYGQDLNHHIYLEEDLGNTTLFGYLTDARADNGFSQEIINTYKEVIRILPQIQVVAGKLIDYSVCYPRGSFDLQSMMWDLNYFKYYFLKLAKIPFDEQALEDDFQKFTGFLLSANRDFFLFRDFQSRNVMLKNGKPYFIDYQGGRKGALQYDIASLLYDAKADIPQPIREELLEFYLTELEKVHQFDRIVFRQHFYGYVLIRIMQALGAYGFRGFYERKEHFLKSVPYAIQNLEKLLQVVELPIQIPALIEAWSKLVRSSYLRTLGDAQLKLQVRIQSFSFKRGIPVDERGHGGGFVFDCRSLPNPGRFQQYKELTGNDAPVINFLEKEPAVQQFINHIKAMLDYPVKNYQERNFTDLMISFGCTGGQHRSVYCANQIAKFLENVPGLVVKLRHCEQEMQYKK